MKMEEGGLMRGGIVLREGVRQRGVAGVREFKKEKRSRGERCHRDISVDSCYF